MKVVQLKCPSCGNALEVEDGLETFFCQYCGHRIVLAEQSEHVVKAKVDIERMKHEERMRQMELDAEEKKRKEEDRFGRLFLKGAIGFFIFLILVSIIMSLLGVDA